MNKGNPVQRKAPIFNRRHYLWLAAFLDHQRESIDGVLSGTAIDALASEFATMLASENPAFNRQAFLKAAGVSDL